VPMYAGAGAGVGADADANGGKLQLSAHILF
jgi:hypothetical protein